MITDSDLPQSIREIVRRDLNRKTRSVEELKGGRNSRIFRVNCDDGTALAAKAYFRSDRDKRDRLGCEFRALQFLRNEGVREIAAPLAADEARGIALYEFVPGQAPRAREVGAAQIDQAVGFLQALKAVADSGKARHFPAASEACFSINAIFRNLDVRFRRLAKASKSHPALRDFLRDELIPFRKLAEKRCRGLCHGRGVATAVLAESERTLSPSDFGFHNALIQPGGRLVFLDFEYFGWDDPAKTVADFLLHPGMRLTPALKRRFFSGMIAAFAGLPKLSGRVRAVYPLFGLKWCAILLNEFLLEDRARRCFAGGASGAGNEAVQLQKARRMLANLSNDDDDSPWSA